MRLTTDKPDGNFETALNMFYAKDGTTWVRGGGPAPDYQDVELNEWIRSIVKKLGADIEVDGVSDEELNMTMAEITIFDGLEDIDGLIAMLYNAAWAFSELNARLMDYEDSGLTPEEVKELKFRMEGLDK